MHADRLDVLQGELQARDERLSALERQVLVTLVWMRVTTFFSTFLTRFLQHDNTVEELAAARQQVEVLQAKLAGAGQHCAACEGWRGQAGRSAQHVQVGNRVHNDREGHVAERVAMHDCPVHVVLCIILWSLAWSCQQELEARVKQLERSCAAVSKVARHRNHAEQHLRRRVEELEQDVARAHAEAASWKRQLSRRQPHDGEWAEERKVMEAEQLALRTSLSTLEAELSQLDLVQLQCELRAVRAREASTRTQLKRREEEARAQQEAVEEARAGGALLRGRVEALEAYVRRLEGAVERGGVDVGGLHASMQQQLELERGLIKQVELVMVTRACECTHICHSRCRACIRSSWRARTRQLFG